MLITASQFYAARARYHQLLREAEIDRAAHVQDSRVTRPSRVAIEGALAFIRGRLPVFHERPSLPIAEPRLAVEVCCGQTRRAG
jgi:hypothetical protein